MAAIAVTYTFSNSTTADATQVNQNFTDIINGLSDGTKDISVSAGTFAGNVSISGNTTLGNASSDDITLTGSLASAIPIKTHNSYDIGSVTSKGLRAIYFASSSATQTAKLQGPAISSDITATLPTRTGTIDTVPASTAQSTTYSATTADDVILVTASADWTLSLFTAVGNTGKRLFIKKTDSTVFKITIDPNGSETIDGATTKKLCTQYESVTLISDGSNWHVLEHKTITPWTSYTPTVGWTTNNTPTGFWRRVGDSIQVQWKVAATGAPAGTTLSVSIPNTAAWTIDTAKLVDTAQNNIGWFRGLDSGTSAFHGFCVYASTTSILANYIKATATSDADTAATVSTSAPMTVASGDTFVGFFTAPITDWWE